MNRSQMSSTLESFREAKQQGFSLYTGSGTLRALTEEAAACPVMIDRLTRWRSKNQFPFLKLFSVTTAGTERWARALLENDERILFIVEHDGHPVGHLGFGNFGKGLEICDVVRGEPAPPDLMLSALHTLIEWGQTVQIERFHLHVVMDATAGIRLYHRAGFVPIGMTPLRKDHKDGETVWKRSHDNSRYWDRFLLHMEYRPRGN